MINIDYVTLTTALNFSGTSQEKSKCEFRFCFFLQSSFLFISTGEEEIKQQKHEQRN